MTRHNLQTGIMIILFISIFYALYLINGADAQVGTKAIGLNSPTTFPVDI